MKKSKTSMILLSLLSFFFTGLAFSHDFDQNLFLPQEQMQTLLQRFAYTAKADVKKLELTSSSSGMKRYEGELAVPASARFPAMHIPFRFYQSVRSGPRPVVMMFPNLLGAVSFESLLARTFVQKGISILIIMADKDLIDPSRPLEESDQQIARFMVKSRYLIDWLLTREDVDPQKIGVMGLSLGAVTGSLLLGIDPRPTAGVLILGGGNLPAIITRSQVLPAILARRNAMARHRFHDEQELYAFLQDHITLDPLAFAPLRSPRDLYMILSNKDSFVPEKNQWQLFEAFGRPRHEVYAYGHMGGAIMSYFYLSSYIKFFQERWHLTEP